jgi:type I restriction enzyme S subunit
MKNWKKEKLGDVCNFVRGPFGGSLKKNIFKEDGYAVYEQQHAIYNQFDSIRYFIDENKFNEMKRFELNSGDLIMSCSGTMGKIAIVPENIKKGIINQALLKLSPSKKVSTIFLKLWMQSESFQDSLKEYSGGAAIQNVASVAILKKIEIPLPSMEEQQRIVSILDEAFSAIAKAKTYTEQNLKNSKELFESYLKSVFENKGKGWEEKRFDQICVLQRGFDLPAHSRNQGTHPLVSSNGITDKIDLWKVKAPGVVTGRSGTIGNVHFIEENFWPLNTALYIKDFHGNNERCIYYFLKQFDLSKYSSGAGVPTLNRNNVHIVKLWFPKSLKEQQIIVQKLDALSTETKKLEAIYQKKINDLEELKKGVLQKAFAGELKEKSVTV